MTDRVTPTQFKPAVPQTDFSFGSSRATETMAPIMVAPLRNSSVVGLWPTLNQLGSVRPMPTESAVRFGGFDVVTDRPGPIPVGGHPPNKYMDEVQRWRDMLWQAATKPRPELQAVGIEHGYLNPGDVAFYLASTEEIARLCARGGFSERFHHWKWGQALVQEYADERLGRSRTFEIVTATKPVSRAYLSENNVVGEQALVMAHVYAHTDFFKNNRNYAHMDPYIEAAFKENKTVIDNYRKSEQITRASKVLTGEKNPVDDFLDKLFSIEELIDFSHNFALSGMPEMKYTNEEDVSTADIENAVPFPNADRQLQEYLYSPQDRESDTAEAFKKRLGESRKIPVNPTRDIIGFLAKHSRVLEPWQQDVMKRFRHEAYYFVPIVKTGAIDEGWTTTWERRLVMGTPETAKEALPMISYLVDSNKNQLLRFSIYSLGFYIWQDIREKAGRGLLNFDWDSVKTEAQRKELMARPYNDALALKEMYRIRRDYDDIRFIQEYFNRDVVRNMRHIFEEMRMLPEVPDDQVVVMTHKGPQTVYIPGLATPDEKAEAGQVTELQARFIKQQLINMFTNSGQPIITLTDANYKDREELYLTHEDIGLGPLDPKKTESMLRILYSMWKKPIHLETIDPETKVEDVYAPHVWAEMMEKPIGKLTEDDIEKPKPQKRVILTCASANKDSKITKTDVSAQK